jgi:hypothetical protein
MNLATFAASLPGHPDCRYMDGPLLHNDGSVLIEGAYLRVHWPDVLKSKGGLEVCLPGRDLDEEIAGFVREAAKRACDDEGVTFP